MWNESRRRCLVSGTCSCSAIHIYWLRVGRGSQSERGLPCLSMAWVTIVRGPAIKLQAFRVFVLASLLAALTTEWQGVIGEAEREGSYSVSSCSVHWAIGLTARINR